jgi:hypothetical protein
MVNPHQVKFYSAVIKGFWVAIIQMAFLKWHSTVPAQIKDEYIYTIVG